MVSSDKLREMVNGFRVSRILLTSLELDLFTIIGTKGKNVRNICDSSGTALRSTEMMLNALCALEFLYKRGNLYFNTDISMRYLNRQSDDYISGFHHSNSLWRSWSTLTEAVRKGSSVAWEDGGKQDQKWLVPFIEAMHDRARRTSAPIIDNLHLSGIQRILDLGGGPGTYAMEIIRQHREAKAYVYDLPQVVELTTNYISAAGLADKVFTIAGDFMTDDIGDGYDLIFISAIIHSYSPDENRFLLSKCTRALNQGGILVVQDYIMDEDRVLPAEGALFAINMLVNTETGGTYTESEVTAWMKEAGLDEIKRLETPYRTTQMIGKKVG